MDVSLLELMNSPPIIALAAFIGERSSSVGEAFTQSTFRLKADLDAYDDGITLEHAKLIVDRVHVRS